MVRRPACQPGRHRPDDDPTPGNRCKDCGQRITWYGPTPYDWCTDADEENPLANACPDCGASPNEPCRVDCLSHVTDPTTGQPRDD